MLIAAHNHPYKAGSAEMAPPAQANMLHCAFTRQATAAPPHRKPAWTINLFTFPVNIAPMLGPQLFESPQNWRNS
jgi:hypothetical protein